MHGSEVPGQLKDGPAQSHGPVRSPDVFGDGVERAEGGNPDPLRVEEKALRAAGLWAGCRKSWTGSHVGTELRSPLPLLRGTSHGSGRGFGKEGRKEGRRCTVLSVPLPSQMQHSSQGGSSLMESRGFPRLGSAPSSDPAQHKWSCICRKPTGCAAEKLGLSFLLGVEGKSQRKRRLSWTGRGGTRQPTHLVPQELLPYVGGHRIPDGNLLWRAEEKQVTLCICRFPALLLPRAGREVADGKCRGSPQPHTDAAPRRSPCWVSPAQRQDGLQHRSCAGCGPVYLCCGCLSVQRHAPLRGRPGSSCSASCRRVAPCWRQPCRSSSFRRVCSLPDAPSGCGTHRRERLHTPPGWPCHKRRHGNAVTACSVLAVAHYDAGTGSLLPAPPGSAAPLCFLSLLFFPLNVALLIFL